MKLRIFSDPHIGVNRQANTSTTSRKKIAQRAVDVTLSRLVNREEHGVCAGDLFDKYRVEPGAMLQAMRILDRCYICMAGNHDTINDRDSIGSLEFLSRIGNTDICQAPYGAEYYDRKLLDKTALYFIPHVTAQAMFEQSLETVYAEAQQDKAMHKLLFLHCNYDYAPERLTSAELNLTR